MEKKIELSHYQLDALTETVSIGAGNAATALSKLVGRKIMIEIPTITVHNVEEAVVTEILEAPQSKAQEKLAKKNSKLQKQKSKYLDTVCIVHI